MRKLLYFFVGVFFIIHLQSCGQKSKNDTQNSGMKIIYIMDPQCGWCYGNSNNITALKKQFINQVDFELLVGGMWLGSNAPKGGEGLYNFLQAHAPRMAATTGMPVNDSYYELAKNETYAFSSLEPSAAIVWLKQNAPNKVFDFAKAIQKALLVEGKRLDNPKVYLDILEQLSVNSNNFEKEWLSENNLKATKEEFNKAKQLANGFPTLLLQTNKGIQPISSGYFELEAMQEHLKTILK